MKNSICYQPYETTQGTIAFLDTGGDNSPIVFIHGNSCSSRVFAKQITKLSQQYRVIALDLPGHGKSAPAKDSNTAYTIPGYAAVVDELITFLNINAYVIVGYSLGGNIALQYSQIAKNCVAGIMLIASAPMKYSDAALMAYPPSERGLGAYCEKFTEQQARIFLKDSGFDINDSTLDFMIDDAIKTDGKARQRMVESVLAGNGADETEIVSSLTIPLAIVAGAKDQVINLNYIAELKFANLWRKNIQLIQQGEHALPVHQANELNVIIEAFMQQIPVKPSIALRCGLKGD